MSPPDAPSIHLRTVSIRGLHGATDLQVELKQGLNVLYGRNGTGKTTFLHVIANLLEADLERFTYLRFAKITVVTSVGTVFVLERQDGESGPIVTLSIDGEKAASVVRDAVQDPRLRARVRTGLGGRPVYLPAFRAVLEAIARHRVERAFGERSQAALKRIRTAEELELESEEGPFPTRTSFYMRERQESVAYKTVLCREWFGHFVPVVRFPSLAEVSEELRNEFETAQLALAQQDRVAFTQVFVEVLRTVFERSTQSDPEETSKLLDSIAKHLGALQEEHVAIPSVYNDIASVMRAQKGAPAQEAIASRILRLYERALQARIQAQQSAFRRLNTFETSVNRFLEDKSFAIGPVERPVGRQSPYIRLPEGRRATLNALSSGERHVLTLLFSATHMSAADGMLLIDEPELSLHVDWQRVILDELMMQAGNRQIVACTHAPEVTAEHRELMIKLDPKPYAPAQGEVFPEKQQDDRPIG